MFLESQSSLSFCLRPLLFFSSDYCYGTVAAISWMDSPDSLKVALVTHEMLIKFQMLQKKNKEDIEAKEKKSGFVINIY